MTQVGIRYIQANDPGGVGAYMEWLDTVTGDLKIRNADDSAWVWVRNVNASKAGLVARDGAAMTGPITGAHGLLDDASPNVACSLKRDGQDVARLSDLDEMREVLSYEMNSILAQKAMVDVASISRSIANRIGWGQQAKSFSETGFFGSPTVPYYPDRVQATQAQIKATGIRITGFGMRVADSTVPVGYAVYGTAYSMGNGANASSVAPQYLVGIEEYQTVASGGAVALNKTGCRMTVTAWVLTVR